MNCVFYAETYHPIQAGSIDGTDVLPHDNAVYRALLTSSAGLYDPFGDPKVTGDPYCSLLVGRLSHFTTEDTLRKAMEKYGRVVNLRLVRNIVTGASRGYAFVEFETEREMRRAYEEAHHSVIDDSEIIVDYNRQQLMPGWIPRRLGGGLGGKKESGQLRFGGRERPFRAPLRPIPHEELKRLGIPPPPEGKYKSRFQVPSPPRREKSVTKRGDVYPERMDVQRSSKRYSVDREHHSHGKSRRGEDGHSHEEYDHKERSRHSRNMHSDDKEHSVRNSVDIEEEALQGSKRDEEESFHIRRNTDNDGDTSRRLTKDRDEHITRSSKDRDERSSRSSKDRDERSNRRYEDVQTRSGKRSKDDRISSSKRSKDHKDSSYKKHRHSSSHSQRKRHGSDSKSPI